MAAQLYLFRHGETAWSLSGQHTGRTDLPLTANGERQALRLSARLRDVSFDHVLSSPLQRAFRTCELAGFRAVAQLESDLQEWDYGTYEGLTTAQIRNRQPGWTVFQNGCPQGESVDQISRRADRMLTRIRSLDGTVALFSHGHFLRTLAARWIGLPVAEGARLLLETGTVSILGHEHGNTTMPVIVRWNTVPPPPGTEASEFFGHAPTAS